MNETFDFDLTSPVTVEGALVNRLVFRAPTGRDFLEAGYPYSVQADYLRPGITTQVMDTRAIRLLLARMATVAPAVIDQLCAFDYNQATQVIPYFLAPPAQKPSSPAPSPPAPPPETSASP